MEREKVCKQVRDQKVWKQVKDGAQLVHDHRTKG